MILPRQVYYNKTQKHIRGVKKDETQVTLPEENGQVPKVFTVYVSGMDSRTGLIAKSRSKKMM